MMYPLDTPPDHQADWTDVALWWGAVAVTCGATVVFWWLFG